MDAVVAILIVVLAFKFGIITWHDVDVTLMFLLWCLKWYLIYRLVRFPFDIWWTARRIRRENAAIKDANERFEQAKVASDKDAMSDAASDWVHASGHHDAALARLGIRVKRTTMYQRLVVCIVQMLRLAKPLKPEWA